LQWPNQLQLSAGLMQQQYEKRLHSRAAATESHSEQLLLPNISLSYPLSAQWLMYSSYSEGLEESGIAPAGTANPGQVLEAVQSKQKELGITGQLPYQLSLIAGVFETEKQFAGVDPGSNLYQLNGLVSHQGLELSVTGALTSQWHWLAGGVVTKARLAQNTQSSLGPEPVAVPDVKLISHLLYSPAWAQGLQLDLNLDYVGRRAVSSRTMQNGQQLKAASYTTVDLGFRYRLPALAALEIRGQVFNLLDQFSWDMSSAESLSYIPGRNFRLRLHYNF
jgi:iron complex outermembrane recepter protein